MMQESAERGRALFDFWEMDSETQKRVMANIGFPNISQSGDQLSDHVIHDFLIALDFKRWQDFAYAVKSEKKAKDDHIVIEYAKPEYDSVEIPDEHKEYIKRIVDQETAIVKFAGFMTGWFSGLLSSRTKSVEATSLIEELQRPESLVLAEILKFAAIMNKADPLEKHE